MTHEQVLRDFPYLTEDDIRACLAYATTASAELKSCRRLKLPAVLF